MKAIEQYLYVVLFVILNTVVLTVVLFVDESQVCNSTARSYRDIFSGVTVYHVYCNCYGSNFEAFGKNPCVIMLYNVV